MSKESEKKLRKIQQYSRVLRRICQGLSVIMALLLVIVVAASFAGRGGVIGAFSVSIPLRPLAFPQRLVVALVISFVMGVLLKGLHDLQRLFGNYSVGEIFTVENARLIRQLGVAALLWGVANIAWIAVASALVPSNGPRSFDFSPDTIVIGLIVILVSWFMDMAAELREENDLTI